MRHGCTGVAFGFSLPAMRTGAIHFQFNIANVLADVRRLPRVGLDAVPISLPFVTVMSRASEADRLIAAELVTRLADRRVLNSQECCDSCIDEALEAFQEIRASLLEVKVRLIGSTDPVLANLIELMLGPIRQFLTFEQSLRQQTPTSGEDGRYRSHESRQVYFDALEQLRAHLSRCIGQLAVIAGLPQPLDGYHSQYSGGWDLDAYRAS